MKTEGRPLRAAPVIEEAPSVPAWHAWVVLLTVPLVLTPWWFFGRVPFYLSHIRQRLPASSYEPVYGFAYFATCSVVARIVVPLLVVTLVLREPLSRFGWRFKGTFKNAWIYLALLLLMLPLIYLASSSAAFQAKYPQSRSMIIEGRIPIQHFAVYHAFYFLLFVSGESFWRGFIIFGLYRHIRWLAIPVMVIPYVMIHYGKPFPEAMGAIVAGNVLGFLALRHGNFWLGVLLHYGVALTMDLTAVARQGFTFF